MYNVLTTTSWGFRIKAIKLGGGLLVLAIALGACVNPKVAATQTGVREISSDCSARLAGPQFGLITAKIATENDQHPSVDKLANPQFPTPAEKQIKMDWARIRSQCRGRLIDFIRSQNLNLAAADFLMAEAPRLDILAAGLPGRAGGGPRRLGAAGRSQAVEG
jgi:hypothetical protein